MDAGTQHVLSILLEELASAQPYLARVSLALGLLQEPLVHNVCATEDFKVKELVSMHDYSVPYARDARQENLLKLLVKFDTELVDELIKKCKLCPCTKEKLALVAKHVWKKTRRTSNGKQPVHAQYALSLLKDKGPKYLDCVGYATSVLAICHRMAARDQELADLARCRLMVSDDHSWVVIQEDSYLVHVEVASETACGQLVPPEQLNGWLYAGGNGVLCSHQQAIAVLVADLMPEECKHEVSGEALGTIQMQLITALLESDPTVFYPTALFRLGLLHQDAEESGWGQAMAAGDSRAKDLFMMAINHPNSKWLFYPHNCLVHMHLARSSAFLNGSLTTSVEQRHLQAATDLEQAFEAMAAEAAVLHRYAGQYDRRKDAELMQSVSQQLEALRGAVQAAALSPSVVFQARWFSDLLRFLDGIFCWLGTAELPDQCTADVLKVASHFTKAAREEGFSSASVNGARLLALGSAAWVDLHPGFSIILQTGRTEGRGKRARLL